jgi:alanine racemase
VPLTLQVETDRWRDHLKSYVGAAGGVVPVTKGNGYGFGTPVLAAEAAALGVDTLAVGTYDEVEAAAAFPGDLLVLSPWRPGTEPGGPRVIHTVSRLSDLAALTEAPAAPQVVIEVMTSMRRHGIAPDEVPAAAEIAARLPFRGWALHLPLAGDRLAEARKAVAAITATGSAIGAGPAGPTAAAGTAAAVNAVAVGRSRPLWVSHLDPADARRLAEETSMDMRLRVGTALWLGDRAAMRARATVLDVHRLRRGDRFGYRQRRAGRDCWLVVVSGGTAHGVALEAPAAATSLRQRSVSVAKGGLEATGRALSPFHIAGKQRWFAEPPHMQCSMVLLPTAIEPPAVGDELDVDVRYTTTTFDHIRWT